MVDIEPAVTAAHLLARCQYINIATSGEAGPWNTPVTGVMAPDLCLYWSSWRDARHSRNVAADARVFITLYDSTRKRGTNHRGCVYLQAVAQEVLDEAGARAAHILLYPGSDVDLRKFLAPSPRRFYRATPKAAWLNDLSERELTPATTRMRVPVSLDALKAARAASGTPGKA